MVEEVWKIPWLLNTSERWKECWPWFNLQNNISHQASRKQGRSRAGQLRPASFFMWPDRTWRKQQQGSLLLVLQSARSASLVEVRSFRAGRERDTLKPLAKNIGLTDYSYLAMRMLKYRSIVHSLILPVSAESQYSTNCWSVSHSLSAFQ